MPDYKTGKKKTGNRHRKLKKKPPLGDDFSRFLARLSITAVVRNDGF
jgi:hypothetical protein